MINFYKHNDIDKAKWNRCVASSSIPTFFADFDLLSIANPTWGALIEDDYLSVMPLPCRNKWKVSYIYSPFYISRLGIFSTQSITSAKVAEFVAAIPRRFQQVDLHLNETNPSDLISSKAGVLVSYRLDLNAPYEDIFGHYATNTKRNVKSARSQGLLLDTEIPVSEVISLFRASSRGQDKAVRMGDADYGCFLEMAGFACQRGLLDTWGARTPNGQLIAGACFLKDAQRTWFWASGRNEELARFKAMFFILDEYIRQHAHQPLVLDFNGSSNPNVARFYRQFGSEKYTCPALNFTRNGMLKPLIRIYKRMKERGGAQHAVSPICNERINESTNQQINKS